MATATTRVCQYCGVAAADVTAGTASRLCAKVPGSQGLVAGHSYTDVPTDEAKILAVLEAENPPRRAHRIAEAAGVDRARAESVLKLLRVDGKAHADEAGSWYAGPQA